MIKLLFIVVPLVVFFQAPIGSAGDLGCEFGDRKCDDDEPIRQLSKLKLTKEQIIKIRKLKKSHGEVRDANRTRRGKVKDLKEKLRQAFAKGESADELRSIHAQIMDLKRAIHDAKFEKLIHIKEILTPEQLEVFEFDDRRTRHSGRKKNRD